MTVHLVSGRELVAAREQAQAAGDDLELLRLREIELAMEGLPSVIDGARRVRLLHHDPISSTWDAWSTVDGQRVLLRCLLP
ncbi:MAG: hypothetical protein QGG40_10520, partial [Myxococcota bacterium]|nr:hypothetical protein [Myxococcota bacterium]